MLFLALVGLISACQPDEPSPLLETIAPPPPRETAAQPPTSTATLSPTATETPIPSPTPVAVVRFAVIGDFGEAGPGLAGVAALIDSWEVDLIITTGDNNYPVGSPETIDENIGQYFHEYISPYNGGFGAGGPNNRFFPSLGNHDWMWNNAQPYLDYFALPGNERYYQFTWDSIDFFAVSSDWAEPDGIGSNSPQADWLQEALAASKAEWQVVYFHHAPYSSGYHGPTPHMQWPFEAWGADVVFTGHDHHYERLEVEGLTYFVVGLCGGPIYAIPGNYPGSQFRYNQQHGALLVEANPDEIWFGFYNIEGKLIDEAKINHGEPDS
ncbi:MAG: metallophosphoesterase [Anaerolineales bacterium]|nr:metallophosphoesterase [Anaerolineales bacterium]